MCTYIKLLTLYHVARFNGGVYWDELVEICSDISRVVGFQGNMVCIKVYTHVSLTYAVNTHTHTPHQMYMYVVKLYNRFSSPCCLQYATASIVSNKVSISGT